MLELPFQTLLQNFRTEYTTLFWQKLLSFQRTFHEKSFGRGLGQMPQLTMHTKSTALPCFFIFSDMLELRSKPPSLTFLSEKSKQKNFPPTTPIYLSEAFEVPRNFSRKVSCVRGWGGSHNIQCAQKSTALPCFFIYVSFAFEYRLYLFFFVSRFHRIFQFTEIANKRVRLFFGIVLIERYKIYILF